MGNTSIGLIFTITGIIYIICFILIKFKSNTGTAFRIKGITAGIALIMVGLGFLLGYLK